MNSRLLVARPQITNPIVPETIPMRRAMRSPNLATTRRTRRPCTMMLQAPTRASAARTRAYPQPYRYAAYHSVCAGPLLTRGSIGYIGEAYGEAGTSDAADHSPDEEPC